MVQITPPEGWKPAPPPVPDNAPPLPAKSIPGAPPLVHVEHPHVRETATSEVASRPDSEASDSPDDSVQGDKTSDKVSDQVADKDFDETIDEAEHLASRGHRLSEQERRIRRILIGAGVGIGGLILILGIVFLILPDNQSEDGLPGGDNEQAQAAGTFSPIEADWAHARTFLLSDSSLFLALNSDAFALLNRPAVFGSDRPGNEGRGLEVIRESLELLELTQGNIRRLEWNSPDEGASASSRGSILVVRLQPDLQNEAARLGTIGSVSPMRFGAISCRTVGSGNRRLTFALVDSETIVMGPEASLRSLAARLKDAAATGRLREAATDADVATLPDVAPVGSSFLPDGATSPPVPETPDDPSLAPLEPLEPLSPTSPTSDDDPTSLPPLAPLSATGEFISPGDGGTDPSSPPGSEDVPLIPLMPNEAPEAGSDPLDSLHADATFNQDSLFPPIPTAIESLGDLVDELDPNATFNLVVDLRTRSDIEMLFPIESVLLDELALPARELIAETDFFALSVRLPVQAPEGTLNEDRSFFPESLSNVSEDGSSASDRRFGPGEIQVAILLASETPIDESPSLATLEERAQALLDAASATSNSFAQIVMALQQESAWDAPAAGVAAALLTEIQRFAEECTLERDVRFVRLHMNSPSALLTSFDAASRLELSEFSPLRDALLESFQAEQIEHLLAAIEAYRGTNDDRFPPGVQGEAILPADTRLSWLVSLLPHLGFGSLTEFNNGASWDGSTNAAGARQPLPPVRNPVFPHQTTEEGYPVTHYVGVAGLGPDAAELPFEDVRVGVFGYRRSICMEDITDGTSQTLAILPVTEDAGPWAAGGPSTIRGLTEGPYVNGPDGFGSGQSGGMVVGMADGSARFLSSQADPEVVEAMSTIHGGEQIEADDFWVRPARALPPRVPLTEGGVAPDPGTGVEPDEGVSGTGADSVDPGSDMLPPDPVNPNDPVTDGPPSFEERPELLVLTNDELAIRLSLPIQAIEFPNTPLLDAVDAISGLAGAPISYDFDWLVRRNIHIDAPLSGQYADASLGKVLADHLTAAGLTYELHNGGIWIAPPEAMRTEPRTINYTVSDLASDPTELTRFATLVTRMVEPQSWVAAGGAGRIAAHNGELAVDQSEATHYELILFCEKLRIARGLPPKSSLDPSLFALSTSYERAAAMRDVNVTLNFFPPGELGRVLDTLEERSGARLVPNWESLASIRLDYNSEASVSAAEEPLEQTLDELLLPLGADYRIVNERTIEILSAQDAKDRHDYAFIPGVGLITPDRDIDDLRAFLRSTDPEHWGDDPMQGAVVYDEPSDTLIVRQCSRAMQSFDEMLSLFDSRRRRR